MSVLRYDEALAADENLANMIVTMIPAAIKRLGEPGGTGGNRADRSDRGRRNSRRPEQPQETEQQGRDRSSRQGTLATKDR